LRPWSESKTENGNERFGVNKLCKALVVNLEGRVAVVTGASSGIGAAVAHNLSRSGVRLVLTARRADRLIDLSHELPGEVEVLAADIAAIETPQRLLACACARFGEVDIVVNNAGMLAMGSVDNVDIDALSRMIRVNFEAVVRMCYTFAPGFKAKRSGSIINVSSVAAFGARPTMGVYAGLKAAIETFSTSLRVELGVHGVKVGCIAPGSTDTGMLSDLRSNIGVPADAPSAEPDDIAAAVRFMLDQPDRTNIAGLRVYSAREAN
jgi:serine 3-dehydrogenase (NADP+)